MRWFSLFAGLGGFVGISIVSYLNFDVFFFNFQNHPIVLIAGSFGASAVLLYGSIKSPLAQVRQCLIVLLTCACSRVTCFGATLSARPLYASFRCAFHCPSYCRACFSASWSRFAGWLLASLWLLRSWPWRYLDAHTRLYSVCVFSSF